MIRYKVSFEITNRVGDSLMADENLDKELFKEKLKEYHVDYKKYVKQMVIDGIEPQPATEENTYTVKFEIKATKEQLKLISDLFETQNIQFKVIKD